MSKSHNIVINSAFLVPHEAKSLSCVFFWFDMLLFIIHTAAGLSGSQMCISIVWCRHQMYLQYGIIETLFISYCDQTISELWDVVWHINSCRTCSGAGCAGCCRGELHYLSDNLVPDISVMRILHTWLLDTCLFRWCVLIKQSQLSAPCFCGAPWRAPPADSAWPHPPSSPPGPSYRPPPGPSYRPPPEAPACGPPSYYWPPPGRGSPPRASSHSATSAPSQGKIHNLFPLNWLNSNY